MLTKKLVNFAGNSSRVHRVFNTKLNFISSISTNRMSCATEKNPTAELPEADVTLPKKRKTMPSAEEIKQENGSSPVLLFAKITENATTPTRGSPLAAGYDLYSAYDYKIAAKGKEVVKTDIKIAVPPGCYGRVAPRSGLAVKKFIDVGAGVIDEDYRGNVGVVLFNFGEEEFEVKKGERIAQLICERIYLPDLKEMPDLDETTRGSGGFGSTGTN